MNGGVKIGRLFGINLILDYSWFAIFILITLALSFGQFPRFLPGLSVTKYAVLGVVTSVLFFASVLIHEFMHSIVAMRYGMSIEGIRLMLFGGVSEIHEEPHSPQAEFTMAIVGPLSSLVLGAIFYGIYFARDFASLSPLIVAPALWLGYINVLLGVFNLLPGFPLDGGRVLRSVIWWRTDDIKKSTRIASGFGRYLAYFMILGGIVGSFLGYFSLIWFALIGFYLLRAAETSYQQLILQDALQHVEVRKAMTVNPETIDPDMSISELVEDHFVRHPWVVYPVVKDSQILGIVTKNSVDSIPKESWGSKSAADIMQPLNNSFVVDPDSTIADALEKISENEQNAMLVIREGKLIGILGKVDIRKVIRSIDFNE